MKNYIESEASEKEYRELARLGAKLRIPVPECFLEMEVTMPDGKVCHSHSQRSHSWVRNLYNVIVCNVCGINGSDQTYGAGNINYKNFLNGGISHSATPMGVFGYLQRDAESSPYGYIGEVAQTNTGGIKVGSSDTPESFEDYQLGATINHGTGAGQLAISVGSAPVKNYDAKSNFQIFIFLHYPRLVC